VLDHLVPPDVPDLSENRVPLVGLESEVAQDWLGSRDSLDPLETVDLRDLPDYLEAMGLLVQVGVPAHLDLPVRLAQVVRLDLLESKVVQEILE